MRGGSRSQKIEEGSCSKDPRRMRRGLGVGAGADGQRKGKSGTIGVKKETRRNGLGWDTGEGEGDTREEVGGYHTSVHNTQLLLVSTNKGYGKSEERPP